MKIIIRDVWLPERILGFTSKRSDDLYWVFLNENLEPGQRAHTLAHELGHIRYRDFDRNLPLDTLEKIAHERAG